MLNLENKQNIIFNVTKKSYDVEPQVRFLPDMYMQKQHNLIYMYYICSKHHPEVRH